MLTSQEFLTVMLIGVIAQATNTDLATNTNILILLLMILSVPGFNNRYRNNQVCGPCCNSWPRYFV